MAGRIGRDAGRDDVELGIGAGVWLRIGCRWLVAAACGWIHGRLLVLVSTSIGVFWCFCCRLYPS